MAKQKINKRHFENLHTRYGTHSEAARQLGITPTYYRYVRKTGKMSEPLARLILVRVKEKA